MVNGCKFMIVEVVAAVLQLMVIVVVAVCVWAGVEYREEFPLFVSKQYGHEWRVLPVVERIK